MAEHFLQTFIATLKQKGKTEKDIQELLDNLVQSSYTLLFTNAMAAFSEEDIIEIEKCTSDDEAKEKVFALYEARTGKNPDDELQALLQNFTNEYLAELEKETESPKKD